MKYLFGKLIPHILHKLVLSVDIAIQEVEKIFPLFVFHVEIKHMQT